MTILTIMTMIVLIFKILLLLLLIIIIMMMMMTIIVFGKMITIKMIRIPQENDRNVMMMMGNRRFSRTPDPEKCVSPQLDLKTSVYSVMNKFLMTKNSFTNQSIYKAFHVTSVVYVTRIVISNILCVSVSLFFFLFILPRGRVFDFLDIR